MKIKGLRKLEVLILAVVMLLGTFGVYEIGKELIRPIPMALAQDVRVDTARAVGITNYISNQVLTPNSTTASSLTVPATANCALITVRTANVSFYPVGTPTVSAGHLLGPTGAGTTYWISNRHQLLNFKVISVSTHGVVTISYGD